jgi:hypothetical protein
LFLLRKEYTMRHQLLASAAFLAILAVPAWAKDRPVTDDEKVKLVAAVAAQGCSGGKDMEFDDDGYYEVDDVRCSDGRKYDLEFDTAFKLTKKKLDD